MESLHIEDITDTFKTISIQSESPRFTKHEGPVIHPHSVNTHNLRTEEVAVNMAYFVLDRDVEMILPNIRWGAKRHEDAEIVTTDLASHEKHFMSDDEKADLKTKEKKARELVGTAYLGLTGEKHERYMIATDIFDKKEILEAQIVDIADKFDALGEALHELRCGNESFIPVLEYYRETKIPSLERHAVWKRIGGEEIFGLLDIPSNKEALDMPRLLISDLKSRGTLREDIDDKRLPRAYRTWLGINMNLFLSDPQPEIFLFPGWRDELRRKWNL